MVVLICLSPGAQRGARRRMGEGVQRERLRPVIAFRARGAAVRALGNRACMASGPRGRPFRVQRGLSAGSYDGVLVPQRKHRDTAFETSSTLYTRQPFTAQHYQVGIIASLMSLNFSGWMGWNFQQQSLVKARVVQASAVM